MGPTGIFLAFLALGSLSLLSLATLAASLAVETSAKNGDDGKQVLCELLLGGGMFILCVHNDRRTMRRENVLDEIVCEAAKSVFVGNMHVS